MTTHPNAALHRFAVFTACSTFLLLIAGALVTSNDAGLSIPDWPLAYGGLHPPMVGGIVYEFSHRVIAAAVGLLTLVLAIWLEVREPRRWVRWFGVAALSAVVAQGLLGGLTVLFFQPSAVSAAHATLAQIFFCLTVSLAIFTGRWWQSDLPVVESAGSSRIETHAQATIVAVFLQLILGAAFRHKAFGIIPHLIGAVVVALLVFSLAGKLKRQFGSVRVFRSCALALHVLIGLQLLLGGAAWWSRVYAAEFPQPIGITVALTVIHTVTGALVLATTVITALVCRRLLRPVASVALAGGGAAGPAGSRQGSEQTA
ncbi:MAG TPA: COX15/CtaA family protein [Methylomirabilota bacterium]|nr:COX15/CtaA family protein [Methylomirabilota bacterium]